MGQSAGAIRAGGAYVELHGKDDGLKSTLKGSEAGVSKWGDRISQVSAGVGRTFAKGLSIVSTASASATVAAIGVVSGFVSAAK